MDNRSNNGMKAANTINTFHIHLSGLVQGVGFRPFVFKLARELNLNGWVSNTSDGVHVEFNADKLTANRFYARIIQGAPVSSKITHHHITEVGKLAFDTFSIVKSKTNADRRLMLAPDFAICDDCRKELHDAKNRRFGYLFITCTNCGPRYSIVNSLPYDRENTTMHFLDMCEPCNVEYNNIEKRRHYSQTNSCSGCGITMTMYGSWGNEISSDNKFIASSINEKLRQGKILAVKGIGGYLLICDANNEQAIKKLRERKHRVSKPFAIMCSDLNMAREIAFVNREEAIALQSVVAPVVLLDAKKGINRKICSRLIYPNLSRVGVLLPYTPLFEWIFSKFKEPIIATSANISGSPIIYKDEDAVQSLCGIADFVITNDREIVVPQDDSVIQFTKIFRHKVVIRRSRGMAPSFFNYRVNTNKNVLATGAILKSSFTFVSQHNIYVSQYLGSMESYEAQQAYKKTVEHYFKLFDRRPDIILADKHPTYFSSLFATEMSSALNIDVLKIQHHHAHFAAVLAENNLLNTGPILGVIWDGTGLGDDGNIWGGEFFVYEKFGMHRANHFSYFSCILGDKMPKEPRISALATCFGIPGSSELLKNKFADTEWKLYCQMVRHSNLKCCSMGRIFDAVSSLLNLSDRQSFEGEAAMLLETEALQYFEDHNWTIDEYYDYEDADGISTYLLMEQIVSDVVQHKSIGFIAAKFHYSLVQIIKSVASNAGIRKIACSGGTFVNNLLVDLLQINLSKDFELYFNKELSPNDENISFGQFVYYDQEIKSLPNKIEKKRRTRRKYSIINTNNNNYVFSNSR
jgi:hydrogenase maturation protein HypF